MSPAILRHLADAWTASAIDPVEYCNDRWISYLAERVRPEGSQKVRQGLAVCGKGKSGGYLPVAWRAREHAITFQLCPPARTSSRFETPRRRVASKGVLAE